MQVYDYLVVGAGFAGSVIAERLAAGSGKRVAVIDRRPHVGGNAYDERDAAGILVHRYGPHIFHTNSKAVFDYLSRFTQWRPYEHRVLASVEGRLVPFPINALTLHMVDGIEPSEAACARHLASLAEPVARIRNSEDVIVSKVGRRLYELFFRGYTRKQWDCDPSALDATVIARIPVRTGFDDRYFTDTYQAMPRDGYTKLFERMLDQPGIDVWLDTPFERAKARFRYSSVIYTGPIDEYFGYRFGRLPYRSLRFVHRTLDCERFQPVAVVNHPNDHRYTRVTEYKHLTGQRSRRTSISYEYPCWNGDPYYPVPNAANAALYKRYRALAAAESGVQFVGRLATYQYYNMDQVVAQALTLYERLSTDSRDIEQVAG